MLVLYKTVYPTYTQISIKSIYNSAITSHTKTILYHGCENIMAGWTHHVKHMLHTTSQPPYPLAYLSGDSDRNVLRSDWGGRARCL